MTALWRAAAPAAPPPAPSSPAPQSAADEQVVRTLVMDEETGLTLSRKLEFLSRSLFDLRLPGSFDAGRKLFAVPFSATDLAPAPPSPAPESPATFQEFAWPLAGESQAESPDLWRPFLDAVAFFEFTRFHLKTGRHPGGDAWRYDAAVRWEAVARMKSGEWRSLEADVALAWARPKTPEGRAGDWQITRWQTERFAWRAAPARLFSESLDSVLRAPQDPGRFRRSQHYEATLKYYRDPMMKPPHPYFAPISVNQKEGLAIADVNGDGFDDIYITVRLGKNLLLMNQGDGTFVEESATYKLDLPGHTTSAIFADFDNDGDLDVMLGRSLLRSSYLENRNGIFFQHPIPRFMPMAVISMTAADYNGDGLLDVYMCTYRPAAPAGSGTAGGYAQAAKEGDFDWPDEFFTPEQARDFRRRLAEHKQQKGVTVLDQLGPPNVLLVNRGGGQFEPAPENNTVGLWRNSLQSTWCDFNEDGRPDLYIPNDWGMNVLFRNDGPAGFKDVTKEMGLTFYGFSMGASFGDYDNDGRDDLYISNMYSEAGLRIAGRIPGLDPQFMQSAIGNFLYHRQPDGKFQQVAGPTPPAIPVQRIGWSWGGCFSDFDNDSFLDLYVMSGYFTAPEELASGIDLESNLWRTMVRSDENLARPSFRFSPEWRRTPPPDSLGPQIDARLAGVERQGDKVTVHSLHGGERNRFFLNRAGRTFEDISGLTGLDNPADSRGWALLDYDRDGWQDVALVNGNQPLFNLYHNNMAQAGFAGGLVALRFVGGSRSPAPTNGWACRDGFGARVTIDLGDTRIVREHRCGEGWSVQNSATMKIGIGPRKSVSSVTVRWPSGKQTSTQTVPEGTLLTVYEDPEQSPNKQAFVREIYRVQLPPIQLPGPEPPMFAVRAMDTAPRTTRLRVYTTFKTTTPSAALDTARLQFLKDQLAPEGVDIISVTLDETDDNQKLAAYARDRKPTSRLVNLPPAKRAGAAAAFAQALGRPLEFPSTVVTDDAGRVLRAQAGLPSISTLRQLLLSR